MASASIASCNEIVWIGSQHKKQWRKYTVFDHSNAFHSKITPLETDHFVESETYVVYWTRHAASSINTNSQTPSIATLNDWYHSNLQIKNILPAPVIKNNKKRTWQSELTWGTVVRDYEARHSKNVKAKRHRLELNVEGDQDQPSVSSTAARSRLTNDNESDDNNTVQDERLLTMWLFQWGDGIFIIVQ